MSDYSYLELGFILLLPSSMFLTGLVLLRTDVLHDQPGCMQGPAVLMALILVVVGPLSAFGFLLKTATELVLMAILCSPMLTLPGLLLLYIGGNRVSKQRRWGSTTARVIESELTQDPSSRQYALSVVYQYTVGTQTYTGSMQKTQYEAKKWYLDWTAENYPVGKEFPLVYTFEAPAQHIFAVNPEKPRLSGIWLIALSLMLFYSATFGVYIWDQLSKYGFD